MFCDKVSIYIKAGNGGDGAVSFLHEKYREFGGPDGGDGGKGGDVIFEATDSENTLYYFKTHHKLLAKRGERGAGRRKHGANGEDLVIKVPVGTVLINEADGTQIGDLSVAGRLVVARGGDGGYGNSHFTSSVRQTPKVAELGEPGEEFNLTLEMKMVADVGLIGLPNVGKSTFLSVVSAAKPKIANYEFTTLIPNLGVVEPGNFESNTGFIVADIPGLIEGASEGRGLGDEFLRHIERTMVLVHFLDATHEDLRTDYKTIRAELKNYKIDLSDKPEIVIVNKIDAVPEEDLKKKLDQVQAIVKSKIIPISAAAHKNIPALIHEIEAKLTKEKLKKKVVPEEDLKEFTLEDVKDHNIFEVTKGDAGYIITGNKIEKFAQRTDTSNPHAVLRFRDILKRMGVDKELRRAGAQKGDKIIIKDKEMEF